MTAFLLLCPFAFAQGLEGGGVIGNVLAAVQDLVNEEGDVAPVHHADVISGRVLDPNGEADILSITISIVRDDDDPETSSFSQFDAVGTVRPDAASDGWRVWNSGGVDGAYHFEFAYTYAAVGEHTISVDATDNVGAGAAQQLTVQVREFIEVLSDPVDGTGAAIAGGRWGGWQTVPGATEVPSNYLRVLNRGDEPTLRFTVAFEDQSFVGADGVAVIPLVGKIQFRCAEAVWPDPAAPDDVMAGVDWTDDVVGGGSCQFSSVDSLMYVQYRIMEIPLPLKAQDYATGFIVQPDS